MRIIFYGVLICILYLFLRYLARVLIQPRKPKDAAQVKSKKPFNLNNIEEADYEEIKK